MDAGSPRDRIPFVLDVRYAQIGLRSGRGRVVVELARALAAAMAREKPGNGEWSLFLAGHGQPPAWAVELVTSYPDIVRYWSGGARMSPEDGRTWPLSVCAEVELLAGKEFLWLEVVNVASSHLPKRTLLRPGQKVIAVVQEGLDSRKKGPPRLLDTQRARQLVKRASQLLCLSDEARDSLNLACPGVETQTIGFGINPLFGAVAIPLEPRKRILDREEFLSRVCGIRPDTEQWQELRKQILGARWIVRLGREKRGKGWETTIWGGGLAQSQSDLLCVRIASRAEDVATMAQKGSQVMLGTAVFTNGALVMPSLNDQAMARLFALSDALIHPVGSEDFGWPAFEALAAGLPVVARAGCPVERYLGPKLPRNFLQVMEEGAAPDAWRDAIARAVTDPQNAKFRAEIADTPRELMLSGQGLNSRFDWDEVMRKFLAVVDRTGERS